MMVVILMGVSGAGKTAVGELLAKRLGWSFLDGDDLHPVSNVEKMSSGRPLTDEDRGPWLDSIQTKIRQLEDSGTHTILACSALKEAYRRHLLADAQRTRLVYLRGSEALIEQRLRQRKRHYFEVGLLASQFEALEEPGEEVVVVDVDTDLETIVGKIMMALELRAKASSEEERQ